MCLLSIHPVSHIFRSCGFLFALIGIFYHPVTMQTTVTIISIAHSFSAAIWGITCRVEDHCSLTVLMIVVIMRDVSPQIRFPFHKPFTIVYSFCIIILILCLFVCLFIFALLMRSMYLVLLISHPLIKRTMSVQENGEK